MCIYGILPTNFQENRRAGWNPHPPSPVLTVPKTRVLKKRLFQTQKKSKEKNVRGTRLKKKKVEKKAGKKRVQLTNVCKRYVKTGQKKGGKIKYKIHLQRVKIKVCQAPSIDEQWLSKRGRGDSSNTFILIIFYNIYTADYRTDYFQTLN